MHLPESYRWHTLVGVHPGHDICSMCSLLARTIIEYVNQISIFGRLHGNANAAGSVIGYSRLQRGTLSDPLRVVTLSNIWLDQYTIIIYIIVWSALDLISCLV